MTSWPEPTREDHEAFCQVEEWRRVRDARGRTGTHHVTYELDLVDGRVLRTRISHPVDRTGYGQGIWKHILRDQLDVDDPAFWSCVQDGVKPARGTPEPPVAALPADLVHLLITRVGLDESEVAGMSRDEAVARLQRYWTEGS
ncbi:cytotoxic translational repressor of toxin-antitoxin stability system [Saccharothrix sp. S26]|uniref:cytotoxic translational repressor of toxin-antitoxin stability system n=1 Tax=Saccharothrix sp. S26 TaxID=2907215 RepID=UPI001F19041B|nr:cytotoxic translational repressor of toxin-antitoxin stability system [Saccharothrix sp. S26]MCE6997645.1 cytotoxic translational repressor of toxin-antitoxin stability system [Saccharothrix sp. S26]